MGGPRTPVAIDEFSQNNSTAPRWGDMVTFPLAAIASLSVLAMVASVGFEVFSRNVFGEPTSWATEYTVYFMVACAFLGAGYAAREDAHVRADLLLGALAPARRRTVEIAGAWVAFAFVVIAAWNTAVYVHLDHIHDTRTWGVMQTPLWIPKLAMPVGFAGLAVAIVARIQRIRPAPLSRVVAVFGMLLVVCIALPLIRSAHPGPLWVFDWSTLVLLAATAVAALLLSGWKETLFAALILAVLSAAFYFAAGEGTGWALTVFVVALLGMLALGIWIAFAIAVTGTASLLFLLPLPQMQVIAERAWSSVDSFSLTALPMFVLMGAFLLRSGLSRNLFTHAAHILRRVPGGLAHASAVASAMFAAVSGSSVATAATIGTVACPEMEKRGYDPHLTYGVVAAGGTLGILIPPSIALLIYGSTMGVSITALFLAGIIPGLMLTASFMVVVAIHAKLRPIAGSDVPETAPEPGSGWRVLPVLLLVLGVLGSMYLGVATPTEAGGVGAILAFFLSLQSSEFGWRGFTNAVLETVKVTSFLLMIVMATGILTYSFDFLHVATSLVQTVEATGWAPAFIAVLVALIYILLGMFIDPISMMLMTLPVSFPLAVSLGLDPVWFGVALVLLIEVGLITPPVGMNLFVLKGIAPKVSLATISYGSLPFVGAILFNLVLIYLFPVIVTWLPSHL